MLYEEVILMEKDTFYMNLALEEAKKGRYQTWKNPMVGAVIVKNGQVLATGYHHHYGQNHAERDAISKLTPEQLFNSTLYVTLEPCNHYGKQPPCSDLIIKCGIKRWTNRSTQTGYWKRNCPTTKEWDSSNYWCFS